MSTEAPGLGSLAAEVRADFARLPSPGRYTIDPDHTFVEFVARHLVVKRVRGRFHDVAGTIVVEQILDRSWVEAEIRPASIDTGIAARDSHLRSADFFDVDNHPSIPFRSTGISVDRPGIWVVGGEVTILGVTRPLEFEVTLERTWRTPHRGDSLDLKATAVIDREAWGLTWNATAEAGGLLIGRTVDLQLSVHAVAEEP